MSDLKCGLFSFHLRALCAILFASPAESVIPRLRRKPHESAPVRRIGRRELCRGLWNRYAERSRADAFLPRAVCRRQSAAHLPALDQHCHLCRCVHSRWLALYGDCALPAWRSSALALRSWRGARPVLYLAHVGTVAALAFLCVARGMAGVPLDRGLDQALSSAAAVGFADPASLLELECGLPASQRLQAARRPGPRHRRTHYRH